MKKVLFIFSLLLAGLTASAQGVWEKSVVEGDELKGRQDGTTYEYKVEGMGSLFIWDWNEYQFGLSSNKQFNIKVSGGYSGIQILVGLYDDDDKLIERFSMWLDYEDNFAYRFVHTRNMGTMSNPVGQKGKVKKIFNVLRSGKGYVRIVAERFECTDYDIKVMPLKE